MNSSHGEKYTPTGEKCRSLIITSGTLSPMSSTKATLVVPFPITLENEHVVKSEQIFCGIFPTGPTNCELKSTFQNRGNEFYLRDLGDAILKMAEITPNGMLIAFASYAQMEKTLEFWDRTGQKALFGKEKPIFQEPRKAVDLLDVWQAY